MLGLGHALKTKTILNKLVRLQRLALLPMSPVWSQTPTAGMEEVLPLSSQLNADNNGNHPQYITKSITTTATTPTPALLTKYLLNQNTYVIQISTLDKKLCIY